PASYLTFAVTQPQVADVSPGGKVSAVATGTSILQVSSHGIQAVTALDIGMPRDRASQMLQVVGLSVAPQELLLPGPGSTQQLRIQGPDSVDLIAGSSGTRYFVSNPAVLQVSADGLLTALALGSATVTVINGPAEKLLTVRVAAPQAGPVTTGDTG